MKPFIALLFALLLTACAGMGTPPADTNNKRLASVEITWKNTLEAINQNIDRFSDKQKRMLRTELPKVESAIKAAHQALDLADQISFDDNVATINTGIGVLRAILETMEETSYVPNLERDYAARSGVGWLRSVNRDCRTVPPSGVGKSRRLEGRVAIAALWQRSAVRRSYVEAGLA